LLIEGRLIYSLLFSAAFYTIDHTILLDRMYSSFVISGCALQWFQSYLSGLTQCVGVNGSFSPPVSLPFGVPKVLYAALSFLSCTTVLFTTRNHGFADYEQYKLYSNVNELKLIKIQGGEKLISNNRTLSLI
jgi:hypothetical protein